MYSPSPLGTPNRAGAVGARWILASLMANLVVLALGCGVPVVVPDAGDVDAGVAVVTPDAGQPTPDAGQPDAGPMGLPVLGNGTHELNSVELTLVAGPSDGLSQPRDVGINPASPTDVWITNYSDNAMVIVRGLGTAQEARSKQSGLGSVHFMPHPSAIAFGATNRMATAHEEDRPTEPQGPSDFMGPSLWPTDSSFEGGQISHVDMLHNSPNAVGIAWDRANVYWVFDGFHNAITRYDFVMDHGPGGHDHSDGIIIRCVPGQVTYVKGVSSGLELDHASKLLYIADTGNSRIAVLDTSTVTTTGAPLGPNYDMVLQTMMPGMTLTTLVNSATSPLRKPSGLALHNGLVYVGDNETSKVLAFDLTGKLVDWLDLSPIVKTGGLMGIDFDPQGRLYVVDGLDSRVMRIAAKP